MRCRCHWGMMALLFFFSFFAVLVSAVPAEASAKIVGVRWGRTMDAVTGTLKVRLVLETNSPVQVDQFITAKPNWRLVVTLRGANVDKLAIPPSPDVSVVKGMSVIKSTKDTVHAIIELPGELKDDQYKVFTVKADPKATSALAQSISNWPNSSPGYFHDLQMRLKKFVESGQLGPFRNGYWGHPAYKLPPEANLMAVAHYLEALDFQKDIVKVHAIFGGKNPHPNWLVGGMPCAINIDDVGAVGAINMERLNLVKGIIDRSIAFCEQVYLPDLTAIAGFYKDWSKIGGGLASQSLLSYGDFPSIANDYSEKSLLLPRGAIINGKLTEVHPVDLTAPDEIQEFVTHSWYTYGDDSKGLHPWDGRTEPKFELGKGHKGTKTKIEQLDESAKYSWIKSPRWKGHAMEVGPLARYVIGYMQNKPEFKEPVEALLKKLDAPVEALFSTLGRTAARGLESVWAAYEMRRNYDELIANIKAGDTATANIDKWEPASWPKQVKGVGFTEAPRGALGHWLKIDNTRIDSYQCIVPTTWNAGPRDSKGQIGAYEASLMNTQLAKPDEPLEILRTLHSFDPCLACSTHVMSPEGEELISVAVR